MLRKPFALTCFSFGLMLTAAFGLSVDGSRVTRVLSQKDALTNSPIQVTVTFTNLGTNLLRGFVYSEQIPSPLSVTPLSVKMGGIILTNFTFEFGQDGDVSAGCTPQRWILELPTNYAEANPVAPRAGVQITYSLTSSSAGTFSLGQFDWSADAPGGSNSVFGVSDSADARSLKFVGATNNPLISLAPPANGFAVLVDGVPNSFYVLQASTNFADWLALTTNASPFTFLDTNTALYSHRFYRGILYDNPWASMRITRIPGNTFSLWAAGVASYQYVLEISTNLVDWSVCLTNVSPFSYLDHGAADVPMRFYRGRLVPLP